MLHGNSEARLKQAPECPLNSLAVHVSTAKVPPHSKLAHVNVCSTARSLVVTAVQSKGNLVHHLWDPLLQRPQIQNRIVTQGQQLRLEGRGSSGVGEAGVE